MKEQIDEKNCKDCLHFEACSKWTDFPKQCGVPVCSRFSDTATKTEVAREIFEKIETLLAFNICVGDVFTGKYFDADLENDIAELKKKYTEKLK